MKQYSLSPSAFSALQKLNLQEIGSHILLVPEVNRVEIDDLRLLLILLNEEISSCGMTDDQQDVNDYGRTLYALYNELYAQE